MKVSLNFSHTTAPYEDPTRWQCSTLRYTPPADFPAFMAQKIGKPKIHRAFITLDEYWDYKTDTYYPDFAIGVRRYPVEELYYPYDWAYIVPAPTGIHFEAYLKSHAVEAEDVMLNVRRLEREVLDGVITFEKYEEVLENALLYCKRLAPNIRYIELCNETNGKTFGNITPDNYVTLYSHAWKVISKLNREQNYSPKLELGGVAIAGIIQHWDYWEKCMRALAQSSLPEEAYGFYSFHHYEYSNCIVLIRHGEYSFAEMGTVDKLKTIVARHRELCRELGLPYRPIYLNEIGRCPATGIALDSLNNACGILTYLIGAGTPGMEDVYLFPWCTFHNPKLQMSYTQFLRNDDGSYSVTPNGIALMMLHAIRGERVETIVSETYGRDIPYRALGVRDGEDAWIVCANPIYDIPSLRIQATGLASGDYTLTTYLVDATQNNCVTGKGDGTFQATDVADITIEDGVWEKSTSMNPNAFVMFHLEKKEKNK